MAEQISFVLLSFVLNYCVLDGCVLEYLVRARDMRIERSVQFLICIADLMLFTAIGKY